MQPAGSSFLQGGSGSLSLQGGASAANLQGGVGNGSLGGGTVNVPSTPSAANTQSQSGNAELASNQAFINQQNATNASTQALLQQQNAYLRQQATPAPVLNYSSILANAQASAANPNSAVNQLYQSQLNSYLQNETAQQTLAQQQKQQSITQAQQGLANTQANLGQQQQYTGQQTALDMGNIANQQNAYQKEQGIQGEQNLSTLRQQLGQGGIGASGLGQQQEFQQNLGRQVSENAQENSFQYQRNTSLLGESNTFANIAQSGTYAQQQEAGQEGQANLDLSKFLQQAAYAKNQAESQLSQWQQSAQQSAASNAASQQVSQFINSYQNNPLLYSKAMEAYSGLTGTQAQPELPNLQTVNA